MRSTVLVTAGVATLLVLASFGGAQTPPQSTGCESIADKQRRARCFEQAGIPVIDCNRARDVDEVAFCREIIGARHASQQQATNTAAQPIRLSQAETDAFAKRLFSLWKPPGELHDHLATLDQYVVTIYIRLNRDRKLAAPPAAMTKAQGPLYDAVRDSAVRATVEAQPYDMLSLSTYEAWKEIKIDFDPRSAPRQPSSASAPGPNQFGVSQQQAGQGRMSEIGEGYQRISFEDFLLDGKKLAIEQAKVSMTGVYLKEGEIEYLFPSEAAVLIAKNTFNTDAAVGLITDEATRDFRKALLYCRNMPLGCAVMIVGHVTMCEKTNLFGASDVACLAAEGGQAVERR